MATTLRTFLFVPVLAAAAVLGCGPGGPPTCPVSGKVTVNGKDLAEGEITFSDDDIKVPSATLPVTAGEFRGEVKAGKKKVRVYMKVKVPGNGPAMFNEGLPGRYNADTELKEEVKPGSDNRFTFSLKTP